MRQLFFIIILLPSILSGQNQIEKWEVFELKLHGPSTGNPFTDVELSANFIFGDNNLTVKGFYDGNGVYKIRFMPDKKGIWEYETLSNLSALEGISGEFMGTGKL